MDITAADVGLLTEALMKAGMGHLNAREIVAAGQITVSEYQKTAVGVIKREYARLTIKKAAKRFGWVVVKAGDNKYTVRR
tara:strand:+ start:158 stop:397 length:240 start_codon:yes stop_codon:yes gene_type:complete